MSIFKGRQFTHEIIIWATRWYYKYGISYRDLEEMLCERGVEVDHCTIYRWAQFYVPKIVSKIMQLWANKRSVQLIFIQPGKPQQNAYVERYNRTVRYDWLNQDSFSCISEVKDSATRWLWFCNNLRPNMALGGISPRQKLAFAA